MNTNKPEEEEWVKMEQILMRFLTEALDLEHVFVEEILEGKKIIRKAQHIFMDQTHENFWRFSPKEFTAQVKAAARTEMAT